MNNYNNSSKKVLLSVIGIAILVIAFVGITFAFFNYTRTGAGNTIKVGRISFNSNQNKTINLTNFFPISSDSLDIDQNNHDSVEITITGDTTYSQGIEYLITAIDVHNTFNDKVIPVSITVAADDGLGNKDNDYFDTRGGEESKYKILYGDTLKEDMPLLVGYIAPGQTGVNETVSINAYVDKDNIAITDTYPPTENGYVINNSMSESELSSCITFVNEIWSYGDSLDDGSTAETFCQGTGTSYGKNINKWYEDNWFYSDELDYLMDHRIIVISEYETNNTTDDWVGGRTVLTTAEWNGLQENGISFKIKVEANEGIWVNNPNSGYDLIKKSIDNYNGNNNIAYIDNMDTLDEEDDDVIYLSGSKEDVNFNYVWYSGKLWRVVALYPDGRMKLITQDMITSINWGNTTEFDGSWIYQWLNEDFYDTLANRENIVDNSSVWNYSKMSDIPPLRPETVESQKTKVAPVGLLNAYEYYNTYRCIESDTCTNTSGTKNYLNIGYEWWLITVYNSVNARQVNVYGGLGTGGVSSHAKGVRPSIVIKSGIEFTGDGTSDSPYMIVGDKEKAIKNTTLINSRSVGEYVMFDNELYRIIDVNNNVTKLIKVEPLNEAKKLSSSVYFGKIGNDQNDDYLDYYLNNTWYNSISPTYKNMLIDDTYYLGLCPYETSYKATICKDSSLDSITIKNCNKYTSNDIDKTFTGKVGISRYGEMFSSQLGNGYTTSGHYWLITPLSQSNVIRIYYNGDLDYNLPTNFNGARPTITLKSDVKIIGGNGSKNKPFKIG